MAVLSLVVALMVPALAAAQQPPTKTLHVVISTEVQAPMVIPGMPAVPMQIPGMGGGGVQHTISARALYDQTPVEPVFLTVPTDLQLADNRLPLHVPKSTTAGGQGDQGGQGGDGTPQTVEFVNKLYWHPDQAEGPITESLKVQTGGRGRAGRGGPAMPDLSRLVDEMMGKEATGDEGKLPPTVKGLGDYVCNTGGTATLDGFLPEIKVTAPDMGKLKLQEPTTVTWEPVPGARGYLLIATGMQVEGGGQKMTSTSWFSTLVQPPLRIRGGYQQETTIADDLNNGILLPGDTTRCVIPGGIFTDINMLTLRVQAIGNDFYSHAGGVTVFGTIRSEWRGMAMIMDMGGDNE
ncbi:hypothetical protein LLH23_09950 [bacterium]|nr:hypothetical protein [bacterium]